jgi:plasmid stability protein
MAILQVQDVDDRLYEALKQRAKLDNRSISQEVVSILEDSLAGIAHLNENATREFLELEWTDSRDAQEIIDDILNDRYCPEGIQLSSLRAKRSNPASRIE